MEKISEITLGKGGWVIRYASLIIVALITLIGLIGFSIIEIPTYVEGQIIARDERVELVVGENVELPKEEIVLLENGAEVRVLLEKLESGRFIMNFSSPSPDAHAFLRERYISSAKIKIRDESLIESILPF